MGWLARILGIISVRGKIVGTIVVVSSVVLVLGAWAAFDAVSAAKQRGRYLELPFQRYKARLEAGDDGATAAAQLFASDPGLVAAFEANDPTRVRAEAQRLAKPLEGASLRSASSSGTRPAIPSRSATSRGSPPSSGGTTGCTRIWSEAGRWRATSASSRASRTW